MEPKILVIDIETAPASGYIWKLFDVNVSLSQLIDTSKVICFAAKWYGEKKVIFSSNQEDTHKKMIKKAWDLRIKLGLLNDQNNIFRLFHAEGDGCPGLVIDYYAQHVIMQCHSIGMYLQRKKGVIEELLKKVIV